MKILEALSVDGKEGYEVLCYGIFSLSELDSEYERLKRECRGSRWHVFRLLGDEWSRGVLLVESYVDNVTGIIPDVLEGFERMHSSNACFAALCMYDAVFPGYDGLFLPETASQTYAFCLVKGEPVIAMDSTVIVSNEWRALIGACRQKLPAV